MTNFARLEEEEEFEDFIDDRASLLNPKSQKSFYHTKLQFAQHRQRPLFNTFVNYLRTKRTNQLPAYSKMSSTSQAASAAVEDMAPLRTLDDFMLGSARFQLPNIRDFDKWGKRVVKNLLYYQTNYFLMFVAIYILMIILNPVKIACGLLVQALLIAIFMQFFHKSGSKINFIASRVTPAENPQQKWYFLAGALLLGYLLLYWFDAVLLTLFTLLLPISVTFVHASLRLRNIKNKMVNAVESFNPSTPMARFLDALNIKAESIIS